MKIHPDYVTAGKNKFIKDAFYTNSSYATPGNDKASWQPLYEKFPDTLLAHHAIREIQTVSLSMLYQYEIQVFYDNYNFYVCNSLFLLI